MMERRLTNERPRMRTTIPGLTVCAVLMGITGLTATAQTGGFDLNRYEDFLKSTSHIDYEGLSSLHPSGRFEAFAETQFETALFSDLVAERFLLTEYEESLIRQHGFVVTERFEGTSFGDVFWQIYVSDLPVYISADALLHAVHMSYDRILMDIETHRLIPLLTQLLDGLQDGLPDLATRFGSSAEIDTALNDLDVYLSVATNLLGGTPTPAAWPANQTTIDDLLGLVRAEQMVATPMFSESCRLYDFSQFTPRGHYTEEESLRRYFQAMIWLGRTELYLIAPETGQCRPSDNDVRRQTLMALLMKELLNTTGMRESHEIIDDIIEALVGEQDNTTLDVLEEVAEEAAITDPREFLDPQKEQAFRDRLAESPFSRQRINSQVLIAGNVTDPESIQPSGAFMLFGQRFVVDSFVTGQVVFAEVPARPEPRMLPNTADVLFTLGNDAALPVLEDDLKRFNYGPQLAALRYLVDGYDQEFWNQTFYNGWLDAIRTLNPPPDRSQLPRFMQTGAWWQKQMTTQLAGWAQLRHDNLLYAKQSYSGGLTCVYPYALVEPIPEFFAALRRLAVNSQRRFEELGIGVGMNFLSELESTSTTLEQLAQKQLDGVPPSQEEYDFIQSMINEGGDSGPRFDGWYPRLFYPYNDRVLVEDLVVADVHTAPTDAYGTPVGWVVHAGTGPVNLAIITTEVPGVGPVTFTGPVMSYYEHVSTNFRRLTDEEWEIEYATAPSFRPDLVNVYLANHEGLSRGSGFRLATNVESLPGEGPVLPSVVVENYPNPFSQATTITFTVPRALSGSDVRVEVFDVRGRRMVDRNLGAVPEGEYAWRWDARTESGSFAAGLYFCRITVGETTRTTTMALVR